jgi:hypothetical protein
MKLLVGCPLVGNPFAGRDWILPKWYEHLMASDLPDDVELKCIFTVHPEDTQSRETLSSLGLLSALHPSSLTGGDGDHRWSKERYQQMVDLRNELLTEVRKEEPDYFFSLDSDVLLHPMAIRSILEAFKQKPDAWAIGAKCFVSMHGVMHPNMGRWVRNGIYQRFNTLDLVKVDILICCYMMSFEAYSIDYIYHDQGEDIGWSNEVIKAGGSLLWDGRYCNKHVMERSMLDFVDERVGF